MVRARLHIICGNCGSNGMFEHKISSEIDDDAEEEGVKKEVVYIACKNCNTVHSLEDYSDPIK